MNKELLERICKGSEYGTGHLLFNREKALEQFKLLAPYDKAPADNNELLNWLCVLSSLNRRVTGPGRQQIMPSTKDDDISAPRVREPAEELPIIKRQKTVDDSSDSEEEDMIKDEEEDTGAQIVSGNVCRYHKNMDPLAKHIIRLHIDKKEEFKDDKDELQNTVIYNDNVEIVIQQKNILFLLDTDDSSLSNIAGDMISKDQDNVTKNIGKFSGLGQEYISCIVSDVLSCRNVLPDVWASSYFCPCVLLLGTNLLSRDIQVPKNVFPVYISAGLADVPTNDVMFSIKKIQQEKLNTNAVIIHLPRTDTLNDIGIIITNAIYIAQNRMSINDLINYSTSENLWGMTPDTLELYYVDDKNISKIY